MKSRNLDTESLLREAMRSTATPDAELARRVKNDITREEPILRKFRIRHSVSAAAVAAVLLIFTAATAIAAWYFLNPSDVAENVGDYALSAAFDSETAVNINASAASGDYIFTFLAVASGKDITDRLYYSNGELQSDRTYAVLAIQTADGTPFDRQNAYIDASFFVSPLIKGTNPAMVNIASMDGGYSDNVADGILYRIIECDNVELEQFVIGRLHPSERNTVQEDGERGC
ncbi:MAG: hypothetical protein LBL37_04860, partial [Gracilibacteraceae bacterium]|nr:hypothetical protein [Gracilibacteraceae bacterium]